MRFSLIAAVAKVDEIEFGFARDALGVSDSALSRQASLLEEAGYLRIRKGYVGKKPRTWFSLTKMGRTVFTRHVEALREIAG